MYVEYTKQLGIWAANNVKYYDTMRNISGEADIFIFKDVSQVSSADRDQNSPA